MIDLDKIFDDWDNEEFNGKFVNMRHLQLGDKFILHCKKDFPDTIIKSGVSYDSEFPILI